MRRKSQSWPARGSIPTAQPTPRAVGRSLRNTSRKRGTGPRVSRIIQKKGPNDLEPSRERPKWGMNAHMPSLQGGRAVPGTAGDTGPPREKKHGRFFKERCEEYSSSQGKAGEE